MRRKSQSHSVSATVPRTKALFSTLPPPLRNLYVYVYSTTGRRTACSSLRGWKRDALYQIDTETALIVLRSQGISLSDPNLCPLPLSTADTLTPPSTHSLNSLNNPSTRCGREHDSIAPVVMSLLKNNNDSQLPPMLRYDLG